MNTYTVKSIKSWNTGDMFSVTFEEANAEPTDFKCPGRAPQVGDKIEGRIEEYTTQSGSVRNRFITKESQKQDDLRQLEINTSWAISNALQIAPDNTKDSIKACAEILLEIKKEIMNG